MSSSTANGSGSLRPTWSRSSGSGGRGFQPPPPVPPERRTRSGSQGSSGSNDPPKATNKFAALDDDEDEVPLARSPPFRSGSFGHPKSPSGPKGRSLADLASNVPEPTTIGGRAHSAGYRSDSFSESTKVVRFTREKLLALRPRPDPNLVGPPQNLQHLEDNPILSQEPLDPVCWDTFDADEIWALAARERSTRSSSLLAPKAGGSSLKGLEESSDSKAGIRRGAAPVGGGVSKWQRGVALPPPDESNHRRGSRPDSDNPNDLWDDPLAATDAALDFSSFGEIPDDPKSVAGDAFDFDKMTKATQAFEEELRGDKGDIDTEGDENGEPTLHTVVVNPHRPLATVGTTIRSGSGDNVNVFEDFDDNPTLGTVKAAEEDPSASSRLMKMIGVNKEEIAQPNAPASVVEDPSPVGANLNPWAAGDSDQKQADIQPSAIGGSIPSNPWGDSIIVPVGQTQQQIEGFDIASRLQQEQQARDEMRRRQSQQEAEMRRRQEEETRRRAMEERARQQVAQQNVGHSEVELVLMERISLILENSWGRSDLISILNTLHAEDSRVIPLLGNVEAMRALIARHPRRVALRQDPAFGAEMAVLLMTNAQFQQQEAQARAQQEQMQRREQQLRMQVSQGGQNGGRSGLPQIIPDAPWFYSDPQKNIQGPFRGEEMRQWLEAGYFKGDLPISQQPSGPFHPLSTIFQDVSFAFRVPGLSADVDADDFAAREAELQRAKEETQFREAERREAERRESERQEAEERALAEAAARKAAEFEAARAVTETHTMSAVRNARNDQNNSSAQLKMMLGLGVSQQLEDAFDNEPRAAPLASPKAQKQRIHANALPVGASPPSKPKPAWGNSPGHAPKKSMSEIQQEEARQTALLAMERKATGRSSSGGWANVAASRGGSSGWQGGAVVPTPAAVVSVPNNLTSSSQGKPVSAQRQVSAPSAMQQQHRRASQDDQHADNFGATMSPALESWCKAQMTKINGSDDLTLVSFCMTLNDPSEIRQYLTAYLGSSPQVSSFAAEFINKRGLGKTQQEEWENTKPKKTRKKGGK